MFFKELETDRLYLKNISMDDREFVFEQFSNSEVNRYLFDAEPVADIQDADDIIDFYKQPEPRTHHRWILIRKSDGIKMGTCGFHCWNKLTGSCDIGYDLLPEFWGKGYMIEALKSICEFALSDMSIKHINACIYIDNDRSMHIAEKLGFVFNGQMKDEIFRGIKYPHKILTLDCTF